MNNTDTDFDFSLCHGFNDNNDNTLFNNTLFNNTLSNVNDNNQQLILQQCLYS